MGLELARAFVTVGVDSSGVSRSLSSIDADARSLSTRFAEVKSWTEQYDDALLKLNGHLVAGRITQETYNRALQELQNQAPGILAAQQAASRAADEHAAVMARGRLVTEAQASSSEKYAQSVGDLKGMLQSGAISQEVYNKAVKNLDSSSLREFSGQLSEAAGVAAVFGGMVTAAFTATAYSAVMAAGQYEQTMIAFSTMMGSAEKATALLNDLTKFAAETPFEMPEIEQVARGLVMFGEESKQLMDTIEMLGNAASGTSSSFQMIGLVYNQIRGVGKLLTQDFRQLSTRGIISLRDLAKYYKITDAEAQKMLSSGKISFEDFRNILMGLTTGAGRFSGMMEKQSKSMIGLISTFNDAWRITLRQIGEELVPLGKTIVGFGIDMISAFANMSPMFKMTVAGVLGVGAALGGLFTTVATGAFTIGKLISAYASVTTLLDTYSATCKTAAAAQWLLNAAQLAMPYVAAAAALAALGVAVYSLGMMYVNSSEKAKKFNAILQEQQDQLDFEKEVGIDFTGSSKEDVQEFISSTESGIAKASIRLKEMESRWFANKDAIAMTTSQIALMKDELTKAKDELLKFAASESIPELDKRIEDAQTNYEQLGVEIAGVTARLEEERGALRKNADVTQGSVIAAEIKAHEDRFVLLKAEEKAAAQLGAKLRKLRMTKEPAKTVSSEDSINLDKYNKKLDDQIATMGMTNIQAKEYELRQQMVEEKDIAATTAKMTLIEAMKRQQESQAAMAVESAKVDDTITEGMASAQAFNDLIKNGITMDPLAYAGNIADQAESEMEKFQKERDAMLAEANQYKSPVEQYEEQIKRLQELRDSLTEAEFSQESFNTAMANAKKGLSDTEKTALKLKDTISGMSGFAELWQKTQDLIMAGGSGGAGGGITDRFAGIGNPVAADMIIDRFAGIGDPVAADMNAPIPGSDKENTRFQNAMTGAADWMAQQSQLKFQNAMSGAADWMAEEQSRQDIINFDKAEQLLAEANKGQKELISAVKNIPKGGLL